MSALLVSEAYLAKLEAERDAAIRRAEEAERDCATAIGKIVMGAGGLVVVPDNLLLQDTTAYVERDLLNNTTVYRARAALRSQESQKPPETENR